MEDVLKELIDWVAKNPNPLDFVLINISHCNGDDCESKTNNLLKKYGNLKYICRIQSFDVLWERLNERVAHVTFSYKCFITFLDSFLKIANICYSF